MTVNVSFQTTPCDNGSYTNIYVWQPKDLAARSTGICSQNDTNCQLTARSANSESEHDQIRLRSQVFTDDEARTICKTYMNAYLDKIHRTPSQKHASMDATIQYVTDKCVEDLVLTGEIEVSIKRDILEINDIC
jgi:hypothetical protein